MRYFPRAVLLIGSLLALGGVGMFVLLPPEGFHARAYPGRLETAVARSIRNFAIPQGSAVMRNPLPADGAVLLEAKKHFADHCASCHGNDGRGDTTLGRNLYPRPPDMRAKPTQDLSDGQLYWIIKNGVRLTGMPAWGASTAEQDPETWGLVHLVRALPGFTESEIREMAAWNPVGHTEVERRRALEDFLNPDGCDAPHPEERREDRP